MKMLFTGSKCRAVAAACMLAGGLCSMTFPAGGRGYWQQRVDTKIEVSLDDTAHFLHGHIRMNYVNYSPDTLSFIYLHLYPNAYKTDRTPYEQQAVENGDTRHYFSREEDRGYMDSLQFLVDGARASLLIMEDIDEARLMLPQPLLPGDSLDIETPFRVKIPLTFSRMGHEGQAYQISQWYPKPAVYDKSGWHIFPYLDQGEFYSEFGTYYVSVTLPKNYILMATGNIAGSDNHEQRWLDSLAALPLPPDTLYAQHAFPPSAPQRKTVHFHEENIHDFAWFADKRWIVRKDTIAVPGSDNIVTAYTCYLPAHQKGWQNSLESVKTAIRGYSEAAGPYPYKTVKAVEGALSAGDGMEYPTVTVIASTNNKGMVHTAIVHEVGHNWFYGMLGSNERRYPWMDEGINSFYEHKLAPETDGFTKQLNGHDANFLAYAQLSATHDLLPLDTASEAFPGINYGTDVYEKTPLFLDWLEAYMGADTFKAAMHAYFRQWQYKHPQPEDFERVFRAHASQNIDWFFNALSSKRPVDFSVVSFKRRRDSLTIGVKNKTGFYAPAQIVVKGKKDSSGNTPEATVWTAPFTGSATVTLPDADSGVHWKSAAISPVIPDYNMQNNASSGPLALRLLGGFNMSCRHKTWVLPAIGYNYYDGFMAGIIWHNITIPQNKFQFTLVPMYSFYSGNFVATGWLGYTQYFNEGWLHDLQYRLEGKTFDYGKSDLNIRKPLFRRYIKVAPELVLNIRKPYPRSTIERSFTLKGYWIRESMLDFEMSADSLYRPFSAGYEDHVYGKLRYDFRNSRTFNPYSYAFQGIAGKDFTLLSAEANLRVNYYLKNKALHVRGYFGKLFRFSGDALDNRYQLAAAYTGQNDYLYDGTYLARNESSGFLSNQISMQQGGFKMHTLQYASPVGMSDSWLAALDLSTDLPFGKLPIRVFGDLAAFPKGAGESGMAVIYEAGLELHLTNYVSLYLPLVLSKDLNDYSRSVLGKNRFLKMISFSLNLEQVPWMDLPSGLLKLQ